MEEIVGKVRNLIFESNSGYKVGLFRVKEVKNEELKDLLNKTISFTGSFSALNLEDNYIFVGEYVEHERYGFQFQVSSYQRVEVEGKDAIVEFLASPLIKGCGEKTALKIVDALGDDAITLIKKNKENLLLVPGISADKATRIYNSLMQYSETDDLLIYLKTLGFTNKESLSIINCDYENIKEIVEGNVYIFNDIINFNKLDKIYLDKFGATSDEIRIKACILKSMDLLGFSLGDTYFDKKTILEYLKKEFNINIETKEFKTYLKFLIEEDEITEVDSKYFLTKVYEMENGIAKNLIRIKNSHTNKFVSIADKIKRFEEKRGVKYNKDQINAIKQALNNNVTIITGGPGTGKTTIINAIVKLYTDELNLDNIGILQSIALLAPTGRASRKISESTGLPAFTIHRYLKWNKDKNEFQINENNKNGHKLIIVDEVSMIDTYLFDSLLKGINSNIKLVLVGDSNQLPSVSFGNVLYDLIDTKEFVHCPLNKIYRQSENSYIPFLCQEIKERNISSEFTARKDDYNFFEVNNHQIKATVLKICEMSLEKGLDEKEIQILAPMYKGENGIDNLNIILQKLFNPKSDKKTEIKLSDIIYRENDKVIQLVNDPDNNVFNGDIGYIYSIERSNVSNKDIITIDFEGNKIMYKKEDLNSIKHAYVMSIHKSQGSEFNHVIIPISSSYSKMLYNKLIYTGISRAKKSLVLIGSKSVFLQTVQNEYANNRKTGLVERIMNII